MTSTTARRSYRPEIDGLRAIAVLAVILNHAGVPGLQGGFLGVDLFFVISGYLITGILQADLAADDFSIARFYERRVRRIIPALMLVMLLCIPPALLLDLPDDLENFGQSLVATTLFANNILLLMTSGYFGIDASLKPLLHSWSLGVEEQYYLAVPLLMLAAWRIARARGVAIGIAVITVASFLFWLWAPRHAPGLGFFTIFARGWEIGAGALAALAEPRLRGLPGKRGSMALAAGGLALAVVPLLLEYGRAGPGMWTVPAVGGLCLVLLFAGASDPAGRLLTAPPLVAIGLVSYSAYLFHQPIFAFTRLASLEPPSTWLMLALVVPIFACAWGSWRFVEQPFRDRRRVRTRTLLIVCGAASLVTLSAGMLFQLTSGFYRNWPELADGATVGRGGNPNIAYNLAPDRFLGRPLPEAGTGHRVLVIGTSFARDFINMGLETGNLDPGSLGLWHVPDCLPLPAKVLAEARRAEFIVLASRFEAGHVPCIVRHVARLRQASSARVIVLGRKSFGWNNNAVMQLPADVRLRWRVLPIGEAVAANDAAKRALPPDVYVDMLGMLADGEGRVPVFTPEGKFISQDREHLTRAGARYVGSILFRHPALAGIATAVRSQAAPPQR
jgi:peptidoglycan/LPS O-acetylase OafA/YrhL